MLLAVDGVPDVKVQRPQRSEDDDLDVGVALLRLGPT